MDVETSNAIEALSSRVDSLGASLRAEIAEQGRSLRAEIAEQGRSLRAEMAEQGRSLTADLRHVHIQVESVRDDIRIVAEGVANLAVKLDRRP